jgi:polar amino acid transport system permease protein
MTFDFSVLTNEWRALLQGLGLTIFIWIVGSALGMLLGLVVALAQLFLGTAVRAVLQAYIGLIRGTPFLIQLFVLYYGGPFYGLDLSPMAAGILGLLLYGGAYFAEIFRTGFQSVPVGQIEAARMAGFTRMQIALHVQFPQMLVIILPALANMVIILSKETAVLSVITVGELTAVVSSIGSTTFAYAETLLFLALTYWVLIELASTAGRALEKRLGRFTTRAPA